MVMNVKILEAAQYQWDVSNSMALFDGATMPLGLHSPTRPRVVRLQTSSAHLCQAVQFCGQQSRTELLLPSAVLPITKAAIDAR